MVTENGDFGYPPPLGNHDISSRRRNANLPRLDPLRINPPFPRPSTADGPRPPHSHRPPPFLRSPRKYPAYPPRVDSASRSASPRLWLDDGSPINRQNYHIQNLPDTGHGIPTQPPPAEGGIDHLPRQMTPPDQIDSPISMSASRISSKRSKTYRSQDRNPYALSPHVPRSSNNRAADIYSEDALRSSMNSAMTSRSSIEHASGTERSSVLTKSSSITDLSPDTPDGPYEKDEGMSVEDAISMYLDGFSDVTEEPGSPELFDDTKVKSLHTPPVAELTLDDIHTSYEHPIAFSTTKDLPPEPLLNSPDQNLLDKQFSKEPQPADEGSLDKEAGNILGNVQDPPPSPGRSVESKILLPGVVPPPLLINTETRDCYGFRKKTSYVTLQQYEAWSSSYSEYAANRRIKWAELLSENGLATTNPLTFPPKSSKVKRFVRKGIPPEHRGAAWFWYAGGVDHLNRNPGLYDALVKQAMESPNNDDKEHIERDLHRTFPDNVHFKPEQPENVGAGSGSSNLAHNSVVVETEMIRSLRRVLYAFALHNPQIGYTQSLNFITGLLLLFLPEEKTFWMLYIITSVYLPSTHEISLEGANIDLWILMVLLKDSLPNVYNKIASTDTGTGRSKAPALSVHSRLPDITLGLTNWLMSVFIGTLPLETTLRVWDVFFYEGSRTFFRVSMGIFKACEKEILGVSDPMEIFQVVQTVPKKLLDVNALLDDSFIRRNRFGQARIDELRAARRAAVRQDKIRRSQALSKGQLHAATDEWPSRSRTPIPGIDRTFADSWRQMRHHAFR